MISSVRKDLRIGWLAKLIVIQVLAWCSSGTTLLGEGTTPPDKSGYTLLNPTPETQLRELSADRPDKTDSPHTVDAGHFELEMDGGVYIGVTAAAESWHPWLGMTWRY